MPKKMKFIEKAKLNIATKLLDNVLRITHQVYIESLDINMDYEEYCKMIKSKALEIKNN